MVHVECESKIWKDYQVFFNINMNRLNPEAGLQIIFEMSFFLGYFPGFRFSMRLDLRRNESLS